MALGEPRVTVAVLCALHRLLVDWRLRANSPDGSTIVREKRNGPVAKGCSARPQSLAVTPRQMILVFDNANACSRSYMSERAGKDTKSSNKIAPKCTLLEP